MHTNGHLRVCICRLSRVKKSKDSRGKALMAGFKRMLYLVLGAVAPMALTAMPLRAQSDRTSWNNLTKARAGQEIEIVLNDARSYKGRVR